MTKLLNWFYRSKLGQLWLGFLVYQKHKQIENEFVGTFSTAANTEVVQDAVQHKYQEGLSVLKKKVNGQVDVVKTQELISLAREENEEQKKFREVMERLFVNKGNDVKDEVAKYEMINKRIGDFYRLQQYNEERALLKQIKQAKKNNDNDLAERLENDWKQRYRPNFH